MEAKIFVIALPTMGSITEKISSVLEDAFSKKSAPKKSKWCYEEDDDEDEDLTPLRYRVDDDLDCPCCAPKWGIAGKPANENLRFGYQGPAIDEPRRESYGPGPCGRMEFEDDHAAFDRYVDAAEDCIERGLEKTSPAPIHRCNAIRKPVHCPPPINKPLIGETSWFNEDLDWNW